MSGILVTGGAGFIGSHLVEALLGAGREVIVLDNFDTFYDPAVKRRNVQGCQGRPGFTLVEGDIRDARAVETVFAANPIDVVVHLAARAGVRPSIEQPLLYSDVNLNGTVVLLEACRRHNVGKFIFGSSSSVYGNNTKVPFSEKDDVERPISPYAATKRAGELLCATYHALYRLNVFCLRFFTVYGPRQRPEMAIHKFTRFIDRGVPLPRFGDGSTSRDYTYITDIITGLVRAVERVQGYEIINLGGSRTTRLAELIAMLEARLDRQAIVEARPDQPGDVTTTWADVAKAHRLLGYDPGVAIEDGLTKFVEWYRKAGDAAPAGPAERPAHGEK
jgi:UDP-glucuronate 4-epimerase